MKISEKEQKTIVEYGGSGKYKLIHEDILFMDSHGLNRMLVVLEHKRNKNLYGFVYDASSEENFFDYPEIFEVEAKQITKIQYSRKDGKEIE